MFSEGVQRHLCLAVVQLSGSRLKPNLQSTFITVLVFQDKAYAAALPHGLL